ncbi:MAG: ThiF family adenylyltransferase [Flavobacterium sp.]|nr:ThiF family adenylyltransferase [Flavobacterium sp.]
MNRYQRQIALPEIGVAGQQKLTDAKVLLVGAGGLGCPVLQNLAAAGVGTIGIVDGDLVEESNLNRQFLFHNSDCGKNKATAAAESLIKQNPNLKIIVFATDFNRNNAFEIVDGFQIIVDCTDNLPTRYLINDVALVKGIPMVYASIHQFEGQLSVFNYQNGPTYRCLFPEKANLESISCEDAGVLGVIPNAVGVMQANEVLKIMLGIGTVLSGKLWLYDGLQATSHKISVEKNPLEIQNGLQIGLALRKQTQLKEVKTIDAVDFLSAIENEENIIIDLREDFEEPNLDVPNIQKVPIDQLEKYLESVDKNRKIILLCQYGNKSQLAADYILKLGFNQVSHLHKGIAALEHSKLFQS